MISFIIGFCAAIIIRISELLFKRKANTYMIVGSLFAAEAFAHFLEEDIGLNNLLFRCMGLAAGSLLLYKSKI